MTDRELMQQVLRFLQQVIAYSNEEMARLDELKKLVRDRLAQPEEEQTRSEKLTEAGYTRRPKGWRDEPELVDWEAIAADQAMTIAMLRLSQPDHLRDATKKHMTCCNQDCNQGRDCPLKEKSNGNTN